MSAKKLTSAAEIAAAISKSPKYRAIAPQAVARIVDEEFAKVGADCEKRARNRLHQIADAFITQQEQRQLWALLERRELDAALMLHASTRERMDSRAEFLALVARHCPAGGSICDAACGLDPLLLGAAGYRVHGLDIQTACVDVITTWARLEGWPVTAQGADLIGMEQLPGCDLTLLMKLLPVLDAQRPGEGMRLLGATRSPRVIVSFPTRTLGGRGVGMEKNYGERFEAALPEGFEIMERFATASELFYALKRRQADA